MDQAVAMKENPRGAPERDELPGRRASGGVVHNYRTGPMARAGHD